MAEFGKRKDKPNPEPGWLIEMRTRDAEEKKRRQRRLRNMIFGFAMASAVVAILSQTEARQSLDWIASQIAPDAIASI